MGREREHTGKRNEDRLECTIGRESERCRIERTRELVGRGRVRA